MNTSNLAITIPTYITGPTDPRASYFKRHLNNLALASRHWPIYVYPDGGSDVALVSQLTIASGLFSASIIPAATHLGLGLNIHRAREATFARGHDLLFLCEDDVVISYDLITLLSHVLDWSAAAGRWPAIANSSVAKLSDDPAALITTLAGWHHYLLPRAAYEMMRPGLDEYAALLTSHDYSQRPHAAIQQWLRDRYALAATPSTYQDAVNAIIARKLGIRTYSLARNRAIHVGLQGTNSTPEWHASVGHTSQNLNPHPDDLTISDFTIIPTPANPVVTGVSG